MIISLRKFEFFVSRQDYYFRTIVWFTPYVTTTTNAIISDLFTANITFYDIPDINIHFMIRHLQIQLHIFPH